MNIYITCNGEQKTETGGVTRGDHVMSITVIGAGVGRTGTNSLKLALNQLGCGPCHHMDEVIANLPIQVPLWAAAAIGKPDWATIFTGYQSAVDWPVASFYRELHKEYPTAKFVLTVRSPESWCQSFSETIYKLLGMGDQLPPPMQAWLAMGIAVVAKAGFVLGLDEAGLKAAFAAHTAAVKAALPANQLLVYEVKQGWEPLCAFLDKPVPAEAFPRTNDRGEFWDRIKGGG
jgi:Sulfotransferase domain